MSVIHTAYCFSSNCQTHGKSIDVIDFVMYSEQMSKHEAILTAQRMIHPTIPDGKPSREVLPTAWRFFQNSFVRTPDAITTT